MCIIWKNKHGDDCMHIVYKTSLSTNSFGRSRSKNQAERFLLVGDHAPAARRTLCSSVQCWDTSHLLTWPYGFAVPPHHCGRICLQLYFVESSSLDYIHSCCEVGILLVVLVDVDHIPLSVLGMLMMP